MRGKETFIHDLRLPGMLYARFLRSPHAHARLDDIHFSSHWIHAQAQAFFGKDLNPSLGHLPVRGEAPPHLRDADIFHKPTLIEPLVQEESLYFGQPYGVVLAESPYAAEDAAEQIRASWTPLPAVASIEHALSGGQSVLPGWSDNLAVRLRLRQGDADAALQRAEIIVEERYHTRRCIASPLETRGVVADYDTESGRLAVWSATQAPHGLKKALAAILPLAADRIDVQVPAVGGAFGCKSAVYPEDLIVPLLAFQLGKPVCWHEDRLEHFAGTGHAREQIHHMVLAADREGRLIALRDEFYLDGGAYNPNGIILTYNTASHLCGPYIIPHYDIRGSFVLTHKTPTLPYRGAGRPEAVFAMERSLDRLARKLGMDPVLLRRKNMIEDADHPHDTGMMYRDGQPMRIDSRRFHYFVDSIQSALHEHGWFSRRQKLRQMGADRQLGIGWASYIEGTGIGPFEAARLRVDENGKVLVWLGISSQGQGHCTTLAQVAAYALQIDVSAIEVRTGDTMAVPEGIGTFASRVAALAGSAVWQGAAEIIEKAKQAASELLEVNVEELVYRSGRIHPLGAEHRATDIYEIVRSGVSLDTTIKFQPQTVTFGGGVHAAVVEVEMKTGQIKLLQYLVTHDGGVPINPDIVEGQIVGGVVQGIGEALMEQLQYDERGQVLTGSFMDYLLPTACDLPPIWMEHVHLASRLNPLGVKGVGEAGAICPPAAIANAVEDAMQGQVVIRSLPVRIPCSSR